MTLSLKAIERQNSTARPLLDKMLSKWVDVKLIPFERIKATVMQIIPNESTECV